jgi:hypothetical protein
LPGFSLDIEKSGKVFATTCKCYTKQHRDLPPQTRITELLPEPAIGHIQRQFAVVVIGVQEQTQARVLLILAADSTSTHSRTVRKAGKRMLSKRAMMAITTKSSMSIVLPAGS